jgi:3-isopropylmalate dehydratase small subunit
MNVIEKILASHSGKKVVMPGQIVDVTIDCRVARDFGGANVVKNILDNGLGLEDPKKTYFTFDCNPGGSDQKYAANQHFCRQYARENDIKVYDINAGIGTHLAIDKGLIMPGGTFVSTDSHANIMGAIGAFGQGMGDQDIAAVWANGSAWFKVPKSVKITFHGQKPENISAKDFALNMLNTFGANQLLGYSVELYGEAVNKLTLDERITISSMGTEMGAIIILFTPNNEIVKTLEDLHGKKVTPVFADDNAVYDKVMNLDVSTFKPMVAQPGHPHDDIEIEEVKKVKIDSAFIGSCTNGRIADLEIAAKVLDGKKVAPGVVLKIVPTTDEVWQEALDRGFIKIFKNAGALVSNAGCAGCAAGQVGQNGPEEVTVSTGNRNFSGKQGKGYVYLTSPAVVAASAVAGFITTADDLPVEPAVFEATGNEAFKSVKKDKETSKHETLVEGRVWLITKDDIDTDMIFHNRYLTITNLDEMGQYTFDNLAGYEDFSKKAEPGDIIITGKNFGAGSSRQQAVDCFKSLGISCILAESYGAIYERNAINAAFPILSYKPEILDALDIKNGDRVKIDFVSGKITNISKNRHGNIEAFSDVQLEIFKKGGLLV